MKFHDALKRAWLFTSKEHNRPAIRCARLASVDGTHYLYATDGTRLVRLTVTELGEFAAWDGKPANILPTVKTLVAELQGLTVIADGAVTVAGVPAMVANMNPYFRLNDDWSKPYPDVDRVIPALDKVFNSCDVDGKELAKAWKSIRAPQWDLRTRMIGELGGPTPPKPFVNTKTDALFAGGLYLHEDGPRLQATIYAPIAGSEVTGNRKHDRTMCLEGKMWQNCERITKPRAMLNPENALQALNGRKAVIRYGTQFDPMRIDFDEELHVIMPMRM